MPGGCLRDRIVVQCLPGRRSATLGPSSGDPGCALKSRACNDDDNKTCSGRSICACRMVSNRDIWRHCVRSCGSGREVLVGAARRRRNPGRRHRYCWASNPIPTDLNREDLYADPIEPPSVNTGAEHESMGLRGQFVKDLVSEWGWLLSRMHLFLPGVPSGHQFVP